MNTHLGHLLQRLSHSSGQAMSGLMESWGLTASQGQILGFVTCAPTPPCLKDIEEAFHLSHPTVSGLLARLEKKGYVCLESDADDHRRKRVLLLPKGKALEEAVHQAIEANEERLLRGFTSQEQAQFRSYLLRAIENMASESQNSSRRKDQI